MSRSISLSPLFETSPTDQHNSTLIDASSNSISDDDPLLNIHHFHTKGIPTEKHIENDHLDQSSRASTAPRMMFLDSDEIAFEDAIGDEYEEEEYEEEFVTQNTTVAFPASASGPVINCRDPSAIIPPLESITVGLKPVGDTTGNTITDSSNPTESTQLNIPNKSSRNQRTRRQHSKSGPNQNYSNLRLSDVEDTGYTSYTIPQSSSSHPFSQHQPLPLQASLMSYSDVPPRQYFHWIRPETGQLQSRRTRHQPDNHESSLVNRVTNNQHGRNSNYAEYPKVTAGSKSSRLTRDGRQQHQIRQDEINSNIQISFPWNRNINQTQPDSLCEHLKLFLTKILLQPFKIVLLLIQIVRSFSFTSVNFLRFLVFWVFPAVTIWVFCITVCCLFFLCCYAGIYYVVIPDRIRSFPVYFDYNPRPQSQVHPFMPLHTTFPSPSSIPPLVTNQPTLSPSPYRDDSRLATFPPESTSTTINQSPRVGVCSPTKSSLFSWFFRSSQTCPASPLQERPIDAHKELLTPTKPIKSFSYGKGIVAATASKTYDEHRSRIDMSSGSLPSPRNEERRDGDLYELDDDDELDERDENKRKRRRKRNSGYSKRGWRNSYEHKEFEHRRSDHQRRRRNQRKIEKCDEVLNDSVEEKETKNVAVAFITFDNRTWESSPEGFSFKEFCMFVQEEKKVMDKGIPESIEMVNRLILGYDTDVTLIFEHPPYIKSTYYPQPSSRFPSQQSNPSSKFGTGNTFILTSPNDAVMDNDYSYQIRRSSNQFPSYYRESHPPLLDPFSGPYHSSYQQFEQSQLAQTFVSTSSFVIMFTLELLDQDCVRVARSTRPYLIFPRGALHNAIRSILNYLPVMFNLYRSTIKARVDLMEGISYNNEKELRLGRLLMSPAIPVYKSQLIFETRLIGVRRLMRDHFLLSLFAFVFVATIATAPLLTCCCFAAYARTVRSLSSSSTAFQHSVSQR